MMTWLLPLFVLLLMILPGRALAVRSCIIDGGGQVTPFSNSENARLCGSEITFPLIRGIYNSGETSERLLTGDGNATTPDCVFGRFLRRNASGTEEVVSRKSAAFEEMQRVQFSSTPVAALNSNSTVAAATHDNVTNSCLSGTKAGEVCHVWSMNHGQNRGVGQGSMIKLMGSDTDNADFYASELSRTIGNSNCGTTRFVLNNCNSGGMLDAIFDSNRRVIPNRCGSASTTEFEKSRGEGTTGKGMTPMTIGTQANVIPSFPTYHHIQQMTGYLKAAGDGTDPSMQRSMDTAHFWSLVYNPVSEQPLLSTDFYLNKHAERDSGNIYSADPVERAKNLEKSIRAFDSSCAANLNRTLVPIRALSTQVSDALRAMGAGGFVMAAQSDLTDTEMLDVRSQLDNARWKIQTFEMAGLCKKEFWDGACTNLTSEAQKREFVRAKYQTFRQERVAKINDVNVCKKKCRRDEVTENSRNVCIAQDCKKFVDEVDWFNRSNQAFRRYEHLQIQYLREEQLYENGSADEIRDFLTLKACERGDFFQTAPARPR